MLKTTNTRFVFLFSATLLESLCMSYGINHLPPKPVSLVFMACGLAVGILALLKPQHDFKPIPRYAFWIMLLPLLLLLAWSIPKIGVLFSSVPVDYKIADMLPIMDIMCRRFVNGTGVYRIIPEIWEGMMPIYLPAMWLPYLIATELGVDLRWVTVLCVFGALGLIYVWKPKALQFSWASLAAYLPAAVCIYSIMVWDTRDLTMADEGPVIAFYVLLVWAIWQKNPWFIGIALALSVLTRYSLLPWIPCYGLWVWFFQSRKDAYIITGSSIVVGLLLMISTGAIAELEMFMSLPKHYITAAMGKDYEKILGFIQNGPGLAKFVTKDQLPILHRFNIGLTFAVPALVFALYYRFRAAFNPELFAIGVLKLTLVVFLNLLIVPIRNLFLPSVFLSLAILVFYSQVKKETSTTTTK